MPAEKFKWDRLFSLVMRSFFIMALFAALLFSVSCGGPAMHTAAFETSMGNFEVELSGKTPLTTKNFMDLAAKGFYDGTRFHRVIPQFMVQGGDPLTNDNALKPRWGTGGPGYVIADEFDPSLSNVRGTIAMANRGPETGGSQFFINVVDNVHLDNKHTVFGKVSAGMDVVDRISRVATDSGDRPIEDVVVIKVTGKS